MRQSISTRFGILVALMLVVLPLFGVVPVAAQDSGLQDDNTYESPQFGYSVTWGEDWSVRAGDVSSDNGGYDEITLRGDDGTLWIQGEADEVTPADAVETRISLEGDEEDIVAQDLEADVPMTEMLVGRDKVLIEGYTLDDAVVVVVLSAREHDFDAALAAVQDQVLLNGEQVLTDEEIEGSGEATTNEETDEPADDVATGEESEESTDEEVDETRNSTVTGGSYTGQLYDYALEFDEEIWEVTGEIDSDESDGLFLENETGRLTIWTWNGYGDDPVDCLDGEAAYYAEDPTVEDWIPAEDANGDPIRNESGDYAYGVFTLTY
ncbi:MAG TPA: hypothetical protein VGR29_08800, partial [Thermomicrobiales bacterium]|nr:hypothetical protein [Thermomicrobiales bacterium]